MAKAGLKVKATSKLKVTRNQMGSDMNAGPRKSGNVGSTVSDGAGSRSRAGLPPETLAIASPVADVPDAAAAMAAEALPVPGVDDKLINVCEPWDLVRDRKLGNTRKGKGQ